jgi:hypothetical protein
MSLQDILITVLLAVTVKVKVILRSCNCSVDLGATTPTAEQMASGIENYHSFDYFATVDRLCGSGVFTGMNYQQVMNSPYEIAFLKMKLNKVDADYQDAYTKVISKRK